MIKAIIFDCFGVLTSDGWLPFKEKYFGDDLKKHEEASRLNHLSDSGKLPFTQLVQMVSDLAGADYSETEKAFHSNVPNSAIFGLIRELKNNYKIAMLSNVSSNWLDKLFSTDQLALFEAKALSYEVGYAKPDKHIYQAMVNRLGLSPSECVFIDDQLSYVDAAMTYGMKGIHFQNNDQLKVELTRLLATDSNK